MLALALLHFVLQGQICLSFQVSRYLLTSYFCISVSYDKKDIFFFLVLVLEGLVGLHRTVSFFGNCHWGIDLDYCGIEWFALEINKDHSVAVETASKAFQTLLLTMRATPFLLRDACPQ